MKHLICFFALGIFLVACNNEGSGDTGADSGMNSRLDTHRQDTMYYERMQQKTSAGDSLNGTPSRSGDTMYYERLPNKTNPPDSSRNP